MNSWFTNFNLRQKDEFNGIILLALFIIPKTLLHNKIATDGKVIIANIILMYLKIFISPFLDGVLLKPEITITIRLILAKPLDALLQ